MKGIDIKIDALKTVLLSDMFPALSPKGASINYIAYGRAFVNERDGKSIPEILSSGNEYAEVKLNDSYDALSYFVVDDNYEVTNGVLETDVTLYFAVNLPIAYAGVTERAVEYLHDEVATILKYSDFTLKRISNGWGDFDQTYQNMQPYYLCRFLMSVQWVTKQC